MSNDESSDDATAGRRDYARSVQTRGADRLSVDLIDVVKRGTELGQAHAAELKQRLEQLGVDQNRNDDAQIKFAELEQINELDEPFVRIEMAKLVDELMVAATLLGYRKFPDITVSSMPGGAVNAMCAPDPFDGSVHIFADTELLIFCQTIGKLVAACIPPVKSDGVLVGYALHSGRGVLRATSDSELRAKVVDLYLAVVFTGRARASKPFVPEADAIPASVFLTRYMDLFALAHEIGHVLANHLVAEESLSVDQSTKFDMEQEFEADELATKLVGSVKSPEGTEVFRMISPYVFLRAISLLEDCQKVFGEGTVRSLSHPVSADRIERVKKQILERHQDPLVRHFTVGILANIDAVFQTWRTPLIGLFEHLKAEGYAPTGGRTPYRTFADRPDILG